MIILELEDHLRKRKNGWWLRLEQEIPELKALAETQQPPEYHAEGNVEIHTRLAIEACPHDCDPDLLWAVLLHDIGKPETTKNINGKITAHGHGHIGAEIAEEVLSRLEMPSHRKGRIVWAIKYHLFHHSWQLKNIQEVTRKQITFIKNVDFPLLLELLRVDSMASVGHFRNLDVYEFYKQLWFAVCCESK